jgi:ligand-binding sensor domain-containing protein
VWGAGLAGLVSLDPATGEIHTYKAADGLLTDTPHAVLAHSDGTLWVGHVYDATRQGEHVQPNPDGTLTMLEPIDYTESSEITSVFRLREQPYGVGIDDVWMGTNEGLCIWDADLGVFSEHAHPTHPHGYSYGVAFTPDADVWNGDQYQLSRWDYSDDGDLSPSADLAETVPTWPVEISYPISITDLDADGATLWVSSSLYGVARVDVSDTLGASTVELFAGEWPSNASAIRADGAGNVWIGGPDGLWRWDGTALHAVTGDWLPSGGVQQITVDRTTSPPTVWIATPSAWVRIVGTP